MMNNEYHFLANSQDDLQLIVDELLEVNGGRFWFYYKYFDFIATFPLFVFIEPWRCFGGKLAHHRFHRVCHSGGRSYDCCRHHLLLRNAKTQTRLYKKTQGLAFYLNAGKRLWKESNLVKHTTSLCSLDFSSFITFTFMIFLAFLDYSSGHFDYSGGSCFGLVHGRGSLLERQIGNNRGQLQRRHSWRRNFHQ